MIKRYESQIKAEKKQNYNRRGKPQLPPVYISIEQKEKTDKIFHTYNGTKKSAILRGLELLSDELGL
jgi:flagellar motility protein MotE (MotC chaperone)